MLVPFPSVSWWGWVSVDLDMIWTLDNVLECSRIFYNVLKDSKKFHGWVVGGIFAIIVSTQVQTS